MRRRDFIALVSSAAATCPLGARAQQATKLPIVGFMGGLLTCGIHLPQKTPLPAKFVAVPLAGMVAFIKRPLGSSASCASGRS